MRKTILTVLAASLIAAAAVQTAAAAERHPVRKAAPTATSQQFRDANASLAAPAQPDWYSDLSNGYMASGPAGR